MAKFVFTDNYNSALERIEDYLFDATGSLEAVEKFLDEHDTTLKFIEQNPTTPAIHPVTGDQSWVFGNGRYRLFFKCVGKESALTIFLTHIIDNKESNLELYPSHKIPTYEEE